MKELGRKKQQEMRAKMEAMRKKASEGIGLLHSEETKTPLSTSSDSLCCLCQDSLSDYSSHPYGRFGYISSNKMLVKDSINA